jgi:hypothetical protein
LSSAISSGPDEARQRSRPIPTRASALAGATFLVTVLWGFVAQAHFSLERGGTHVSRYGDGEIKAGPCGRANGGRGTNIYTYAPGETITIRWVEFVPHPGYYRVAFDEDGDDGFMDPRTVIPPNRSCNLGETHCGANDFYNNHTVLLDDLGRHSSAPFNQEYEYEVTLPDVECDNCTLQVIQVIGLPDPLDGGDLATRVLHGEREAGVDPLAVDEHGARTAGALVAALLRAGQP